MLRGKWLSFVVSYLLLRFNVLHTEQYMLPKGQGGPEAIGQAVCQFQLSFLRTFRMNMVHGHPCDVTKLPVVSLTVIICFPITESGTVPLTSPLSVIVSAGVYQRPLW
jgi:hypothetical protein